jgi:hypothetical protein
MADRDGAESGIRQTTYRQGAGAVPTEATEVTGVDVLNVNAETVILRRSGAQKVTAERASLEQSGTMSIEAKSVQMDRSSAMTVRGEQTVLQESRAGLVQGNEVRLVRSRALVTVADQVHLDDARVWLLAGKAEGNARVTFTPVSAAVAGVAFGGSLAMLLTLFRLIFGKGTRS